MTKPPHLQTALAIQYRDPRNLRPASRNARTHSADQINKIANSIQAFGFNNPMLLDASGGIVAGHGRVAAAIQLGLSPVPTGELAHLSDEQRRAYILADNRLAEMSDWDKDLLAIELQDLMDLSFDFSIADIGFDTPDLDVIIERQRTVPV